MFTDKTTPESLKALIGNVEWIYHPDKPGIHTGLDLVFRVNGELRGLTFYLHEPGLSFGPRGRENRYPSANSLAIEELSRDRLLTAVTYIESRNRLTLLNESERDEWAALVEQNERKQQDIARKMAETDRQNQRRQYEELKAKFEPDERGGD